MLADLQQHNPNCIDSGIQRPPRNIVLPFMGEIQDMSSGAMPFEGLDDVGIMDGFPRDRWEKEFRCNTGMDLRGSTLAVVQAVSTLRIQ